MSDCVYYYQCKNAHICERCQNLSLLETKMKFKSKRIVKDVKAANADDSWKDLEREVVQELNNVPNITEARRTLASGALWFDKSDVVDSILRIECKERSGEKSFAIPKEWLTKISKECTGEQLPCLAFRFKGDDIIYDVMPQKDLMQLIMLLKSYVSDNERLTIENSALRKALNSKTKEEK